MKIMRVFEYQDLELDYSGGDVVLVSAKDEDYSWEIMIGVDDVGAIRMGTKAGSIKIDDENLILITQANAVDMIQSYKENWIDSGIIEDEVRGLLDCIERNIMKPIEHAIHNPNELYGDVILMKNAYLDALREFEDSIQHLFTIIEE